jgi:HSP20 family molecular chaperone IbpA
MLIDYHIAKGLCLEYEWRPFVEFENPTSTELFRLKNPIVEEDGVKKFKLELDVRRFSSDDIKILSDAKNGTLTIEAKQEDESSKFEYRRKVAIPEGVELPSKMFGPRNSYYILIRTSLFSEITCKHRSDGVLTLEAPYTEPKIEPPTETPIKIEHK